MTQLTLFAVLLLSYLVYFVIRFFAKTQMTFFASDYKKAKRHWAICLFLRAIRSWSPVWTVPTAQRWLGTNPWTFASPWGCRQSPWMRTRTKIKFGTSWTCSEIPKGPSKENNRSNDASLLSESEFWETQVLRPRRIALARKRKGKEVNSYM